MKIPPCTMSDNQRMVSIVEDEIDITDLSGMPYVAIFMVFLFSSNDHTLALEHFTQNKQNYALMISDRDCLG